MKVDTITCHNVYNVGASLQAYALAKYLSSLGHDVNIIDYQPDYLKHYRLWGVKNPKYNRPFLREAYNLLKLPGRLIERLDSPKKEFDAFTSRYLPLTSVTYCTNEELLSNPPKADLLIAGSDQIWNSNFQNGRDPSFYLNFAQKGEIRASYAASFATDHLNERYREKIAEWINQLDFVSVRESSGVQIVRDLGRTDVVKVVDPVFLLGRKIWEDMAALSDEVTTRSYVLIYDFDKNKSITEQAKRIASEKKCETISIFANKDADKSFHGVAPIEFLWLVKHAEAIITNSFHATAFSVMFEKPFIVFDRQEPLNSRLHDLLSDLELKKDSLHTDFSNADKKLSDDIERSQKFLDTVIQAI